MKGLIMENLNINNLHQEKIDSRLEEEKIIYLINQISRKDLTETQRKQFFKTFSKILMSKNENVY